MLRTFERLASGERAFIVCIGDSITEQNYHLQGNLNYVGQLTERWMELYERRSRVLNAGSSGDSTWGVLERLERDALRFKPDLVTVMLGINDSHRGMDKLDEFKHNVALIIRRIVESGSEVLLLTQNILDYAVDEQAVTRRQCYPAYVKAYREVAVETQTPICDIYQQWEEHIAGSTNAHLMLMDDSIHPNSRGHEFMAKVLYEYLELPK